MKISITAKNGAMIEIDFDAQTLTASIPADGALGEIVVTDGTPPIVNISLPFGEAPAPALEVDYEVTHDQN